MRIDAVQAPEPSTELAVINIGAIVPVEFFKAGGSNDILTQLEISVRAQAAKLDISTESGREGLRSLAYQVACSKRPLDDLRKGLTEDIRKQKEAIDAEGRTAQGRLEALQQEVRKPLTDWENAEKARVAAHEECLKETEGAGTYTLENWANLSIEAMRDRLREIDTDKRDYQEFTKRFEQARALSAQQIFQAIDAKEKHEAAQAELERLRAEAAERAIKEREEAAAKAAKEEAERKATEQARIAHEAAERERQRVENERIEAEARAKQAEAQRIAAEERAARELKEAEDKRKREAEQAEARRKADAEAAETRRVAAEQEAARRAEEAAIKAKMEQERAVEAERQRIADEQKREAEEAEKRAKNRAHQASVNREALAAFVALGATDEFGKAIIKAIAGGDVPHVRMEY